MELNLWQPLAGLGLFLFAMRLIEETLEALSGQTFRNSIRRHTDQPLKGVAAGGLTTAVLQSSSLVGLMTLALVGAGVMRLKNALGIIFGANLGTTATGWIVATLGFKLDLDAAALPLIGVGGTLAIVSGGHRFTAFARMLLALGLLLMGLSFMKNAVSNLAELVDPAALGNLSALQYLAFGVVFSAIVQSSSATMMVTLSALHGGVIDLPSAAAVAIGADLGTTGTLLIGAVRGNAATKRVAAGHFLFNLITDLAAFALRIPLLAIVAWLALSDLLSLVAFHSLFNFLGILLFLPFTGRFAKFLERFFREDSHTVNIHLSPETLKVVDTAVEAADLETGRLIKRVIEQNLLSLQPPLHPPLHALPIDRLPGGPALTDKDREFADAYERSKRLEGEILAFTTDLQVMALTAEQSAEVDRCQTSARDAIHSSKNLKDVQSDLRALRFDPDDVLQRYGLRFRDAEAAFYENLLTIKRSPDHVITVEDFAHLISLVNALHEDLHGSIYNDVREDRISERQISVLLNVNREIYNSNQVLLLALSEYLLTPEELVSLELVDGPLRGSRASGRLRYPGG